MYPTFLFRTAPPLSLPLPPPSPAGVVVTTGMMLQSFPRNNAKEVRFVGHEKAELVGAAKYLGGVGGEVDGVEAGHEFPDSVGDEADYEGDGKGGREHGR